MQRMPINAVLAANLAHFMSEQKLTQMALSKKTGVSQRSISNYLRPADRAEGKSGKAPSAKLSEVELIARALGVETWELLRFVRPSERDFYRRLEQTYRDLVTEASTQSDRVKEAIN